MEEKLKLPAYGGQALIEGVLMRGSHALAAAMRAPDKTIIIHKEPLKGIYKSNIKKIPFLRGLILLWDALGLGMRYLTMSANVQTGEDEKIDGPVLYLTMGLSIVIGVGVFFAAPAAAAYGLEYLTGWNIWWSNLVEGVVRLLLMVGYIWSVGKIPDIARVFAYHGAEHKTINAYEAGADLTPESVATYSVEHPRCGTSFVLTLVLFSIILFSLLGPLEIQWRLISRIALVPVLAGVAYEYMRWTANHLDMGVIRWIVRPNMLLQKLTTREPDLEMLEVSITAFKTMLEQENELKATAA